MYHVPSGGHPLAHLKQHNVNIFSVLLSGIVTEWCQHPNSIGLYPIHI